MDTNTDTLEFEEGKDQYYGKDLEILLTLRRYQRWIMDEIHSFVGGRALEVGAGIGSFSKHLFRYVDALDMIEPSDRLSRILSEKFSHVPNATTFGGSVEQWLTQGISENYDTVIMINVLEHIEDDKAVLKGMLKALKVEGNLVLYVPAMPFLFSKLDAKYGHFRRYTLSQLRSMLEEAGFSILDARYIDLLGILPWWLVNKVMGKTTFNMTLTTLWDHTGVPLTMMIERYYRPPIGKNIILIARRGPAL